MNLLKSDKIKLPHVYFISDRSKIKDIPIGVPFIYGDKEKEKTIVRILEYETLYQRALASGYPFDFRKILKDEGFDDLIAWGHGKSVYMDYMTEVGADYDIDSMNPIDTPDGVFKDFIKDSTVYVDIQKLKDLKVFPIWLSTIEEAVHTNIHNFAMFNNNMYNKKLEGMYGGLELKSPGKNLIIIDISGSIPRGVSSTCLALSKNLAETFYADLMITGSKTTLYNYENIHTLNIDTIYDENGMDNDQVYFKKIVSSEERNYKTAIVFGDDDSPCHKWRNKYNSGSTSISRADGKKLCKWNIEKLISFHTRGITHIAAYADWFTIEEKDVQRIENWVTYLNK